MGAPEHTFYPPHAKAVHTKKVYNRGMETKETYPPVKACGMHSLNTVYRIGMGPSSSHTMAPRTAALRFMERFPDAKKIRVELFGSLAATGKGHFTDLSILGVTGEDKTDLQWHYNEYLPYHVNGMRFSSINPDDESVIGGFECYSTGGGALYEPGDEKLLAHDDREYDIYELNTMNQILEWCEETGKPIHEYVYERDGVQIKDHLRAVWKTMVDTRERGIKATGVLPGGLLVPRKANSMYKKLHDKLKTGQPCPALLFVYALAVMEENAMGGQVVTAPTCGSCGVVPSVLGYLCSYLQPDIEEDEILNALATAGIVGNIIKTNASIAGAEVGCQGEVGSASSMAAAAATYLMGGSPQQIEYAAEIAMEHFLGMTCDPVEGLVQIPCIERNVFGATRAIEAAEYAMLGDGRHRISFDTVILTMKLTGLDIEECYRETSHGGLASTYNLDNDLQK
eukprot:Ihof_evm2s841 gene=Ihof_evmTU2s841